MPSRVRSTFDGLKPWLPYIGVAGILLASGGWIYAANDVHNEHPDLQQAVKTIANQQVQHFTKERYQECEVRCIPIAECPSLDHPLPASRCRR